MERVSGTAVHARPGNTEAPKSTCDFPRDGGWPRKVPTHPGRGVSERPAPPWEAAAHPPATGLGAKEEGVTFCGTDLHAFNHPQWSLQVQKGQLILDIAEFYNVYTKDMC